MRRSRMLAAALAVAGLITPAVVTAAAAPAAAQVPPESTPVTFGCADGAMQTYAVPPGITRVAISLGGGGGGTESGGEGIGGRGARLDGTLAVGALTRLGVQVGCAGSGQSGGRGWSNGASGGSATVHYRGGGGGGASAVVLLNSFGGTQVLSTLAVASGGGGGGGSATHDSGSNGGDAGLNTGNQAGPVAEAGGPGGVGGGGGGGGGGYRGGRGGNRGSFMSSGQVGSGGSSYIGPSVSGGQVVQGGTPRGSGYVTITPIPGTRPGATVRLVGCEDGVVVYTVPAGVYRLDVSVLGASGGNGDGGGAGGRGAAVHGQIDATPGHPFLLRAGCEGNSEHALQGIGNPGRGGTKSSAGGISGSVTDIYDGGDGGGASGVIAPSGLVVIAGGGGGGGGGGAGGTGGAGSLNGQAGSAGSGGSGGAGGAEPGNDGNRGADIDTCGGGGGGGGSGLRGGSGGRGGGCRSKGGGGGGGGSSWVHPTLVRNAGFQTGGAGRGNGLVIVSAVPATTPSAPVAVAATPGDRSATVTITPPVDDGGVAVTGYQLTTQPGGQTQDVGPAGTATVTGLTNGTAYTITVRARNAIGLGAPTSAAPVVPRTLPQPPTSATAVAGNGSATVSFVPPVDTGGLPILRYNVTSSPSGFSATGPASPITVTGLTNGVTYVFIVTATTAAGTGGAQAPTNPVTPSAAPVNDNYAAATQLSGDTGQITGTNAGATRQFGEPDHGGGIGSTIWYRYTATHGGAVAFDTCGTAFPVVVQVYSDGPLSDIVPVGAGIGAASCPDGSNGTRAVIDVPSGGRSFNLVVDGAAPPGQGPITLRWQQLD